VNSNFSLRSPEAKKCCRCQKFDAAKQQKNRSLKKRTAMLAIATYTLRDKSVPT
jgi:hypothetical protein